MDRDWTASFSIRFRNGTCIIILDKKYNIANSSCHFGSYGSIWTSPYTAIWPSVPWTICYMLKYHYRVARVQVFVNSIISPGDILLHSKILLYTSARFIGMLSFLQRGRIERWQGRSQKCVWIYNAINKCKFLSSNIILWSETNFVAMQINI
jgi:hypothetical protein